ncbi:MAG: hypothetical protein U0840_23765 [Gemmataceae bacterium]
MTASSMLFATLRLEGLTGRWGWVWPLFLLAGAAFLVWTYHGIYVRSGRRLAWWLFALRATGLLLLFLMLAKPTWTQATEEVDPGHVAIVVDTSRSMTLPDTEGKSRYDRTRQVVESLQSRLRQRTGAGPLEVDLFDIQGAPLASLPAEPVAEFTDLTRAIRRTQAQMRSRNLAAIVLISDGADTTGRPSFADWEDTGVPIHTIGFPRGNELDLLVREPTAPRRVIVHNEITAQVPVAKRGAAACEATVTLRRGRETLATRKVIFGPGDAEQVVALNYKPDQPGSFELTASVEGSAGEKDIGNNAVNFALEVVKDPIRVLYLEGYLRNEYTFLVRHFTEKDPDVALIREPRRTGGDGPDRQLPEGILDDKTLEKIDVVILGDMEADYLTPAQQRSLIRWLDGKNHSLLVLGGYSSFGARGWRTSPLAEALPVVFTTAAEPQSEQPFSLQLTDRGRQHPIFTMSNDPVRSEKMWQAAPPLDGMPLVARGRPGAEILAVNPQVQEEGKPAVALAVQRAPGGGQVMVLCPDTTWKWSRLPRLVGQDDTLYSRFWSQAIRWLAGRALEDSRPVLSVRTERPIHEAKSKVAVRLQRQPRPGSEPGTFHLEVVDPKGAPVQGLVPQSDSADPDLATVEFFPTLAGRYEITASLRAEGKVLANQTSEIRVRGSDLELADGSPRPDHLRAIKEATGGTYFDIDQADNVAEQIPRKQIRRPRVQRSEYWDSPWLFAGFLAAVTAEWFLRRRNHLV